jgi:hypothetical protein
MTPREAADAAWHEVRVLVALPACVRAYVQAEIAAAMAPCRKQMGEHLCRIWALEDKNGTQPPPSPCAECGGARIIRERSVGLYRPCPSCNAGDAVGQLAAAILRGDDEAPPAPTSPRRLRTCVQNWPQCAEGLYDPRCCRFPKSCSCTIYDNGTKESDLEPPPPPAQERGPERIRVVSSLMSCSAAAVFTHGEPHETVKRPVEYIRADLYDAAQARAAEAERIAREVLGFARQARAGARVATEKIEDAERRLNALVNLPPAK